MDILARLIAIPTQVLSVFFAFGTDFSLPSLVVAFCVATGFLALRQRRRHGRASLAVIRRAIFKKRFLTHRSVHADIGFFFLNTLAIGALIGGAVFGAGVVTDLVRHTLNQAIGGRPPVEVSEALLRAGMTLLLFLAYEFGYWLDHYLKHTVPFLWETHKPHHSAEVLTPWTVWRVHPLDTLVFTNILSLSIGSAAGVAEYLLGRDPKIFAVDGANLLLVFCIYAYVHLQHSQFWIPFRGLLGRLLMSPAHHQIHHSIDPRHHNRNFGSCLAVWDWLFGTLEMPPGKSPRLKFGVDLNGEDPQSITSLLITPTTASLGALLSLLRRLARSTADAIRIARFAVAKKPGL